MNLTDKQLEEFLTNMNGSSHFTTICFDIQIEKKIQDRVIDMLTKEITEFKLNGFGDEPFKLKWKIGITEGNKFILSTFNRYANEFVIVAAKMQAQLIIQKIKEEFDLQNFDLNYIVYKILDNQRIGNIVKNI
jgi:hypothetical protein